MSRTRRTLTVLALMTGLMTVSLPASASFQDTTTVQTAVTAGTVSAPASVTFSTPYCYRVQTGGGYWSNGVWVAPSYTWYYQVTASWPAPVNTKSVTGYRVMAHMAGQSIDLGVVTARTLTQTVERAMVDAYRPQISIITQTAYGWTAETARIPVPTC